MAFIKNFFKKFKINFKDIALAGMVFLIVYTILYYFTNWNTKPVFEKAAPKELSFAEMIDSDDQSLAAANGISLEEYNIWAEKFGLAGAKSKLNGDSDGEGLPNFLEYIHGTDPQNPDTDGDGYDDKKEITNGYDPDAPGDARIAVEITIPKIGISAPMIWSAMENEKGQLADLMNGVAHFPKTASPGQNGDMIISGHSSNYFWAKGNYNYIFKNLNNLEPGDTVEVKTVQQNGKIIIYSYKIREKFTTLPNDARIFENSESPIITLSTCWPLGTNLRRLIVKGELI